MKMARTSEAKDGNHQRFTLIRPREYLVSCDSNVVRREERRGLQQSGIGLDSVPGGLPNQLPSPVVGPDVTTSPNSDQSTGSDNGISTISTCSASTSSARKREATPGLVTSISSMTSDKDDGSWVHVGSTSKRRRYTGRETRLPQASTSENLLQVGLHSDAPSAAQLEALQDQHFVFLGTGIVTNRTSQTEHSMPWAGQNLHQDTQPQDVSPSAFGARKGIRTHGFSKAEAQKISDMRKTRACLKCHLNRDQCDEMTPCSKCKRKLRTWRLGCTRARFEDFESCFPPTAMRSDLQYRNVFRLIRANASTWTGRPFDIFVKQELGGPQPKLLRIQVREADLLGEKLLLRPLQRPVGARVETVNLESPPILPYYDKNPLECLKVKEEIQDWLREVAETRSEDFHWYWYPVEEEDVWERSVLGEICTYFHENATSDNHLGDALLMTTLVYTMIHPFTIPEDQVEDLYMGLCDRRYHKKPTTDVSPRAVNKLIAMLLLPNLMETCSRVLLNLKEQLIDSRRSRNMFKTSREVAFCVAYLTILVIGHLQNTMLQYSTLDEVLGERTTSREDAEREIWWMEDLSHLVIELTVVRLRKDQPKPDRVGTGSNHEPGSFFDLLRRATRDSGETFEDPAKYQLGVINQDIFVATNPGRILRKFYRVTQLVI